MDRRIIRLAAAIATTSLLAACASGGPVTPKTSDAGFRATSRNGEQVYCKRELLTGSRTQSIETCLTAAQLEKQRNGVDALVRRTQDMNGSASGTDGSGGRFNNVMSTSGRPGGQ